MKTIEDLATTQNTKAGTGIQRTRVKRFCTPNERKMPTEFKSNHAQFVMMENFADMFTVCLHTRFHILFSMVH
jgi:hypothetical protein